VVTVSSSAVIAASLVPACVSVSGCVCVCVCVCKCMCTCLCLRARLYTILSVMSVYLCMRVCVYVCTCVASYRSAVVWPSRVCTSAD
jgi:hypothetical protein